MKIFCSNNPKNLAAKLAEFKRTATVEAEFGDDVVEGSVLTLAHHGPRSDNSNPCLEENKVWIKKGKFLDKKNWEADSVQAIGLSHIDLDALGGVAAIMGRKPGPESFWEFAAHIDSNGPHRAADSPYWETYKAQYYAYCVWAREKENQYSPPKDGGVEDVTERIEMAIALLGEILEPHKYGPHELGDKLQQWKSPWLAKGAEFEKKLAEDEARCLIESGRIRIFVGDIFCSAFYRNADGTVAEATVSFGTKSGAITLAFEDGGKKHNAAKILQDLFGSEAGGHAGIAGSPRGKRMNFGDLAQVVVHVKAILEDVSCSLSFLSKEIFGKEL